MDNKKTNTPVKKTSTNRPTGTKPKTSATVKKSGNKKSGVKKSEAKKSVNTSKSANTSSNKGGFVNRFKQKPLWYRVFMITSAVMVVVLLGMIAYAYRLMGLVNYDDGQNINKESTEYFETVENPEDYTNLPIASIETLEHEGDGRSEAGVYNILLLGLDKDSGNLSDSMIVVTIDTNDKALKLTSFMRDTLVTIPGYSNNRINTVYRTGGIDLLKEVFAKNFNLCIDGYVAVNFSSLTQVINKLGGVSVYMTEAEAEYLNTTNYIADPQYRNLDVYTGTHWLNGAQATGYARIRHVSKGSEANDQARTSRQRQILEAIFDQFKNQSLTELLSLMESVLPLVTTDFTVAEMTDIATKSVAAGVLSADMQQFRIPVDNSFQDSMYNNMRILDLDFEKNIDELHRFVFGDTDSEGETSLSIGAPAN